MHSKWSRMVPNHSPGPRGCSLTQLHAQKKFSEIFEKSKEKTQPYFFSCCKTLHVANLTRIGYILKKVSKSMKVPQFGTKEHPTYLICDFSSGNIISVIFFSKRFLWIKASLNSPFFCYSVNC